LHDWERVFTRWVFESRFAGRRPILELGPGRCFFVRQAPGDIVAIDTAVGVVEHYAAEGLDIRVGDACDLPFEDDYFEGVYSCWLLEHLPNPDRCLKEIKRVTKPGGYVCLIVPSAKELKRGFYDDWTHIRPYTPVSLGQLAADAGFASWSTNNLVWTRGLRRLIPTLGDKRMVRVHTWLDRYGRRLGLTNQYNLIFEATA
jgi:SAM-dependent methyltransferase